MKYLSLLLQDTVVQNRISKYLREAAETELFCMQRQNRNRLAFRNRFMRKYKSETNLTWTRDEVAQLLKEMI
jgi:uncharacterized protein YllA (UPF0747 family)